MDQSSQFEEEAEQFIGTARQDHDDMLKKVYANIPVAPEDPDYSKKVNAYLTEIGFEGIMKLLGYDDLKIAKLVMEGLEATKFNHYENYRETDLKTRLAYLYFIEGKIKEGKQTQNALVQNNITYIPHSWFHPEKIIESDERRDRARLEQLNSGDPLNISVGDDIKVTENN
jgi:hypothetical protein